MNPFLLPKRVWRKWLRFAISQIEPKSNPLFEVELLGSEYGGKSISIPPSDKTETIFLVSAGVGEDISFDVDFANKYKSRVILVDPTPRSKVHVAEVFQNLGQNRQTHYSSDGKQNITAYNLQKITEQNLEFFPVALWNKNDKVKFFPPKNPDHVSFSIGNLQSTQNNLGILEVEALTLQTLMIQAKLESVDILKLDIEGAEFEVLRRAFLDGIFPRQIVLEIDEFCFPTIKNLIRGWRTLRLLGKNNYFCVYNNYEYDYCFLRNSAKN
jgi:FkbM family methyltransferase